MICSCAGKCYCCFLFFLFFFVKVIHFRKLKETIVIGNIIDNVTSSFSKAISYECYVTCADFWNYSNIAESMLTACCNRFVLIRQLQKRNMDFTNHCNQY